MYFLFYNFKNNKNAIVYDFNKDKNSIYYLTCTELYF